MPVKTSRIDLRLLQQCSTMDHLVLSWCEQKMVWPIKMAVVFKGSLVVPALLVLKWIHSVCLHDTQENRIIGLVRLWLDF